MDRENDEMRKSRKYDPNEKIVFTQYYEYDDVSTYILRTTEAFSIQEI